MLTAPTIRYLTDIYFGFGMVKALPEILNRHHIRAPLIITDEGLIKLGITQALGIGTPATFDRVETNPTESMVVAAVQTYRECGCDGMVAVGGGSSIDLAKCAAILVHHGPPLEQYAVLKGGMSRITSAMPPLIAVPTTAGSGSEVGRAALITLVAGTKVGLISDYLLPSAAICDPALTVKMPAPLTAGTGMDALSHCVETFCSLRVNPVADAMALDGLERGYRNILKATRHGADPEARAEMMMCSLEGGLAFQKGLGAVHSLSHPLGALTEKQLHHGTLNAIFLPVVLRCNFDFIKDKAVAIARRLGIRDAGTLPDIFAKLNEDLGLPNRLRDLGLEKEDLYALAQHAKDDHCTPTNPRPLDVEDFRRLYLEAW
jgi:4-hydroxybutyrate dehydrogenase